jgi:hypothetical protein
MMGARDDQRGGLAVSVGVVVGALALGLAGGFAAGELTKERATTVDSLPLQAASPSMPFTPYSADVTYPSWQPDLEYRDAVVGSPGFAWTYEVPKGWVRNVLGPNEVGWGVDGHPVGSYGFRIELVLGQRSTPESMVEQKLRDLRGAVADVRVLEQGPNTLAVTYRSLPENWLRYNTFRWFAAPGSTTAAVEISVNGRAVDQAGMNDVLEHVSATLAPR